VEAICKNTNLTSINQYQNVNLRDLGKRGFRQGDSRIEKKMQENIAGLEKRKNEVLWIMYVMASDAKSPTSDSYWRFLPGDLRNLIMEEICKDWHFLPWYDKTKEELLSRWKKILQVKK
jgi:hypothetical protein